MNYETTIGLEIHVELKTKTKMFCDSLNDPNEKHPNLNVCPVCMGHPGTLPTINKEAVNKLIGVGLALNCRIAEFSKFDRKNYFYPDLPKGYQISQYDLPLCKNGWLNISAKADMSPEHFAEQNVLGPKKINIERIHLEEDTGRLLHPEGSDYSLVDFNRAGIPLMELVTEPDLKSGEEIEKFAKELRLILKYLDASDADMEKGQMRVEVNISVKKAGAKELGLNPAEAESAEHFAKQNVLGTKVELKNINSIKAASAATDYEIKRQTEELENGKKIIQETRGWDEDKGKTFSQRIKEGSADYRYFPEPDLPPMKFSKNQIEELRLALPELPRARGKRFKEQYGITDAQITVFTIAKHLGDYYEKVASELDAAAKIEHLQSGSKNEEGPLGEKHLPGRLHTLAANYIITEFPPLFQMGGFEIDDVEGIKIQPEAFAELMVMIFHEKLSSTGAKMVLKEMAETGLHPEQIIKEKNLGQVSDAGELMRFIELVITNNPQAITDYQNGKVESLKFLIGQVMALTHGKANPQITTQTIAGLLAKKLK